MFKKYRYYLLAAIILGAGILMLFNKVLVAGVVTVGIGILLVMLWEWVLKQKARQFEALNKALLKKEEENEELKEELDAYSRRKLNISEVNTITDLGLFEVNTSFKRTIKRKLKNYNKDIQFLGVVNVDFIAKYGVDFRKLKYRKDEKRNEIVLANAVPEFLSFTKRNISWELDEILEFNIPFMGTGHWRTSPRLERMANEIKEEVRLQVEKESENGPDELRWLMLPLKEHVERALRIILGAQGYKVRFTELESGKRYASFMDHAGERELESMEEGLENGLEEAV